MPCYSINGIIPVVSPESYVHPTACLIGDVIIAAGCYIGPCASLRGDMGRIIIGADANIQDGCVLHCGPGGELVVEAEGHIGHGAVLHGCKIGRNVLVGINTIVMDDAVIGESAILAASTFIKTGFVCPPRTLVMGTPGRIIRELTGQDLARKKKETDVYKRLTERCLQTIIAVEPLKETEAGRKRLSGSDC